MVVVMGDEKEFLFRGYLVFGIGYSLLVSEGSVFVILRIIKKIDLEDLYWFGEELVLGLLYF